MFILQAISQPWLTVTEMAVYIRNAQFLVLFIDYTCICVVGARALVILAVYSTSESTKSSPTCPLYEDEFTWVEIDTIACMGPMLRPSVCYMYNYGNSKVSMSHFGGSDCVQVDEDALKQSVHIIIDGHISGVCNAGLYAQMQWVQSEYV